ncbi:MAG: thioredoxin [Cytophagaceae bacterium]
MEAVKPKFNDLISNSEKPVLVDFYADWCGPCKAMAPIIEEVAGSMQDKVKIIKINVDKNQGISGIYRIQGIPTFILFKKGKIVWRQSGMIGGAELKKMLEQNL